MGQAARKWHHRRCNQLMERPDAPAERLLSTGVACCRPGRPHSGHPHFALAGAAPAVRFATDSALEGADSNHRSPVGRTMLFFRARHIAEQPHGSLLTPRWILGTSPVPMQPHSTSASFHGDRWFTADMTGTPVSS
jgi:hypothetical protein